MQMRNKFMSPGRAILATICAATLALPLFADQIRINPDDYKCSFTITFPGYSGSETLTDFPVLIRLSAERNAFDYSMCKVANGGDLRFADSDGNLLASEVDTWNENGESLVWVKVPSLNADTVITAYYGCATPDAVTPSDVWSNGYLGVWHMGESASPLKASTQGAVEFATFTAGSYETINGIQWAQTGIIGGATKFGPDADYTNSCLRTTSDDASAYEGMNALTVEAWSCRDTDAQNTGYILDLTQHTANNWAWRLLDYKQSGAAKASCFVCAGGTEIRLVGSAVPANTWTFKAFTYDSQVGNADNFFLYVNGKKSASKDAGGGLSVKATGTGRLYLGNDLSYNHYTDPYPGRIDEVRISNVARSADWVTATYDTVNNEGFAYYETPNDWKKYTHTFTVTFTNYTGSTALAAFPALVKISESLISGFRYADCCKPGGGDLRFADEDGNILASEVETWNTSGESSIWVCLPSLTNNATITAYYGWKWAPGVNGANVWTNGYVAVWHMNDATLPMTDSSNGGTSLTENKSGATLLGQSGLVGNAVEFDKLSDHTGCFQTTDQRYKTSGRTDFTVEFWSYQDSFDPTNLPRNVYFIREYGSSTIWQAYGTKTTQYGSPGKTVLQVYKADGQVDNPSTGDKYPLRGAWTYQNFRLDGSTKFYQGLNRTPRTQSKTYPDGILNDTSSTTLFIGNTSSGSTSAFPGKIDEVRISSVARSDDWMNATYDTIKNAESFVAYSPAREQTKGYYLIIR